MVQKFRATFFYLRNGVIIWMWMELRFTKIQHWPRCERRAHSISCQLLVERNVALRGFGLWEFQKRLELQTALIAAKEAEASQQGFHALSTWPSLHLRRSNFYINSLMFLSKIGAQHVLHIDHGKIDRCVMMVSKLERFQQYHLILHIHVQLQQVAMSTTQSRSLRWYLWILKQTSLVAFPFKRNHSFIWWWELVIQNVCTCATTSPASDKFNNVLCVLDWHWAWPHVTKPLQLATMETHFAKTLCKGLEVWTGLWCTMSRKSFHWNWAQTTAFGLGRWGMQAGVWTGMQLHMDAHPTSWSTQNPTRETCWVWWAAVRLCAHKPQRKSQMAKSPNAWQNWGTRYFCGLHWQQRDAFKECEAHSNRLEITPWFLHPLRCTNLEVQSWFWRTCHSHKAHGRTHFCFSTTASGSGFAIRASWCWWWCSKRESWRREKGRERSKSHGQWGPNQWAFTGHSKHSAWRSCRKPTKECSRCFICSINYETCVVRRGLT